MGSIFHVIIVNNTIYYKQMIWKKKKNEINKDVIDITQELDFDFEMNENILHKDPNLYTNMFSPISDSASKGEETN